MEEYKFSDDFKTSKHPVKENSNPKHRIPSFQNIQPLLEQFHNFDQFTLHDIETEIFKPITKSIELYPEKSIQIFSSEYFCDDCIKFFCTHCSNEEFQQSSPNIYFEMIFLIVQNTSLFAQDPKYFSFVFLLLDNISNFHNIRDQISILNIISSLFQDIRDLDFLNEFLVSNYHFTLIQIANSPSNSNDNFVQYQLGGNCALNSLYKQVIESENQELVSILLKTFFTYVKPEHFYNFIETFYVIIHKFPDTYTIIYKEHTPFFYSLFHNLDPNYPNVYSIFRLLNSILPNIPFEDPPSDIDDNLNWDQLMRYFHIYHGFESSIESSFKQMLLFSASLLKFGSPFFFRFDDHHFFERLINFLNFDDISFDIKRFGVKCLTNAITFRSADTQKMKLFDQGVIRIFLQIIENDSDEEMTREILDSIEILFHCCENCGQLPLFTSVFHDEEGYSILISLNTCNEKAHQLLDEIPDPENNGDFSE